MDIKRFEEIIWEERHDEFIETFCGDLTNVMKLMEVCWNTKYMRIGFYLQSGRLVHEIVVIEDWNDFVNNVKETEKS